MMDATTPDDMAAALAKNTNLSALEKAVASRQNLNSLVKKYRGGKLDVYGKLPYTSKPIEVYTWQLIMT